MARRKNVSPGRLERLIAQLQASGDTTRLLEIMRDKTMPPKARLEAAKRRRHSFTPRSAPSMRTTIPRTNNVHTFA
jgi:hypothetical protein